MNTEIQLDDEDVINIQIEKRMWDLGEESEVELFDVAITFDSGDMKNSDICLVLELPVLEQLMEALGTFIESEA